MSICPLPFQHPPDGADASYVADDAANLNVGKINVAEKAKDSTRIGQVHDKSGTFRH
jgi:hypothetical protein